MRLSGLYFALALYFGLGVAEAQTRTELHLFKYLLTNTERLRVAYQDFSDLLLHKIPQLAEEISSNVPEARNLRLEKLEGNEGDPRRVNALAQRFSYWSESGALAVLTGRVGMRMDTPYIHTEFFWGELRGSDPNDMVRLEISVTGRAFETTNDSHSAAILYALAHEVGHNCEHRAPAIFLLSEARKRALSIDGALRRLGDELVAKVDRAIEHLRSRCVD